MLIRAAQSQLLIIDPQERLLPSIHDGPKVVANCRWLLDVARRLAVPVAATVQYPKGLGPLAAEVASGLEPCETAEKIHFSAVADGCLPALPGSDRPQVVVAGTEAHVCVLQTAIDLHAAGKQVFVVADAVGSRRAEDRKLALARMRQLGLQIVTREMVAFEWLHRAGTDVFRAVSREFIR